MYGLARKSERRSERLLDDLLASQGWDLRKPPHGDQYLQTEYRDDPSLASALSAASKSGEGSAYRKPSSLMAGTRLS